MKTPAILLHLIQGSVFCFLRQVDLPQVYFVNQKKIGKGKIRKGESENSLFTVSARLITDDEIDLGQVYTAGIFPLFSPWKTLTTIL